ncbi:hypothetical protein [Blastococcus brunescens]|uniref:hypothetical protein n=1 Tax=Blastococcus brunescens TaxID=1564165 RepID=UPI003BEF401E
MINPPTLTAAYWIQPYGEPVGTPGEADNTLYLAAHSTGTGKYGFDPLIDTDGGAAPWRLATSSRSALHGARFTTPSNAPSAMPRASWTTPPRYGRPRRDGWCSSPASSAAEAGPPPRTSWSSRSPDPTSAATAARPRRAWSRRSATGGRCHWC